MVPEVRIKKLYDDVVLPSYQTAQAAGMDVAAYVPEPVTLQPMERRMIPTGLQIALPEGYEAQVRARSGLSLKHGITMVNGVGTIDADYRGEVGILLINLGNEPFVVEPGMRIAQLVFTKYSVVAWREVTSLEASERGAGGFGSTGVA